MKNVIGTMIIGAWRHKDGLRRFLMCVEVLLAVCFGLLSSILFLKGVN